LHKRTGLARFFCDQILKTGLLPKTQTTQYEKFDHSDHCESDTGVPESHAVIYARHTTHIDTEQAGEKPKRQKNTGNNR
jgi:hypothetical protein